MTDVENTKRLENEPVLNFLYTNYKGETSLRSVVTPQLEYTTSEYHNDGKPCWLMLAWDLDKDDWRSFDILQIHSFENIPF